MISGGIVFAFFPPWFFATMRTVQLKARQRLGKYRIERRIASGGFATVYRAKDTIEGVVVALKVPHDRYLQNHALLDEFKKEARIAASLDHANILPIKNAMFIDDVFVIASPLGDRTFLDRIRRRVAPRTGLRYAEQMLEAVACAHKNRIIHLDIKPENFIMFDGDRLRLSDFGISKVAVRTSLKASGTGTLGYVAPEQALGKPSYRSDVFSLGLVMYRMFSGVLPEWPYEWPLPSLDRLKANFTPAFIAFLARAIQVDQRDRYPDAMKMLGAFRKVKARALRVDARIRKKKNGVTRTRDWRTVRFRQFKREHGQALGTKHECKKCGGPMSEAMHYCPWCGEHHKRFEGVSAFPVQCGRCQRGMKKDWRYCAWCYGAGYEPDGREYADVRYTARCSNPACSRKELMPFMRYCPWCRTKVKKPWPIEASRDKCSHCGWGTIGEFWTHCPWCGRTHGRGR